jgi:hypothetical protein
MFELKRYLAVAFIALFMTATLAGAAMAHCDQAGEARSDTMKMEMSDGAGMDKGHHSASGHTDNSDSSSNCFDCEASVCQNHTLAPVHTTLGLYNSSETIHTEVRIDLGSIFLTRIPRPPKQLS